MIARSSGAGLLLVVLAGCHGPNLYWDYTCDNPDPEHLGPDGEPDPCHKRDVGGDLGCDVGEFAHWKFPWETPTLLWVGPEDQAPECPRGPTTISYEGHADLVAPNVCEACTCEPPTGSCALPSTLKASMSTCGHFDDGPLTSFNAPTPWDGSCDSTTQTPSGAAHSLTIDPIAMTENGCAVGPPVAAKVVSLRWDTFARGCDVGIPTGRLERSACLPAAPIALGFKACIFFNGESDCPNDAPGNVFTERHVFYQGVKDDRQCSACTCGAPTGSACTATVSIYKNPMCSGLLDQKTISSSSEACTDIQLPGQVLGSKSAGPTTYLPGMCPPGGGDGSGIAIPTNPTTLCCRP
jgi:hypothetical protein